MNPDILPGPPRDLAGRNVPLLEFGGVLFRTHNIRRGPIHFGKTHLYRFDAPDGAYGVLYAATDAFCAFIEAMVRVPGRRVVTTAELKERSLSELKPARPLRLIDLTQSGSLVQIGADARLFSGPHPPCRDWSEALHRHPVAADGLLYPSRLDPPRHGLALFEDRAPKLNELMRQSWYAPGAQRRLLTQIVEHYRINLIENHGVIQRKPASGARQEALF